MEKRDNIDPDVQFAEPPEQSCKVLKDKIEQISVQIDKCRVGAKKTLFEAIREIAILDLLTKMRSLSSSERHYYWKIALQSLLTQDSRGALDITFSSAIPQSDDYRIAIVTTMDEELDAVKIAFGIDLSQETEDEYMGYRYWGAAVATHVEKKGDKIEKCLARIIITKTEEGQQACQACSETLFSRHKIDVAFLIGIGVGLKEKNIRIGDVVAGNMVLYYEKAVKTTKGDLIRPDQFPLKATHQRDLGNYNAEEKGWHAYFKKCLDKLISLKRSANIAPIDNPDKIHFHKHAVILSGEKYVADGSMPKLRKQFHERTRALDMDSAGFAYTCHQHELTPFVFRGISDYGQPNNPKKWKHAAALAAATAAKIFIETELRLRPSPESVMERADRGVTH